MRNTVEASGYGFYQANKQEFQKPPAVQVTKSKGAVQSNSGQNSFRSGNPQPNFPYNK